MCRYKTPYNDFGFFNFFIPSLKKTFNNVYYRNIQKLDELDHEN